MPDRGGTAAHAGKRVQASPVYRAAVTGGLWSYGLVHLLLAWLTFQLIQTPGGSASNEASLAALAALPLGRALMIATAVGLGALVVWQLLEAVLGYPWLSGAKRVVRRIASGFRAAVYLSLAVGAGQLASGSAPAGGTAPSHS